jgi:hypothetical protein
MRRVVVAALGVAALLAGTARPASALLVDSRLVCDTDEDTVFGEAGDGSGRGRITSTGEMRIRARGLKPNTTYTCRLACMSFFGAGLFSNWNESTCQTDADGKVLAVIQLQEDPLAGCILPSPVIARGGLVRCFPGFGTYDTTPN